jgi:hypothetical protein
MICHAVPALAAVNDLVPVEMFVSLVAWRRLKTFNCRHASSAPTRCRPDASRDHSKVPALAPVLRRRARLGPAPARQQLRRTDTSPSHASHDASKLFSRWT